jgi:hypothetical protein
LVRHYLFASSLRAALGRSVFRRFEEYSTRRKKAKDALTVADYSGYHIGPVELAVCGEVVVTSEQLLQISW